MNNYLVKVGNMYLVNISLDEKCIENEFIEDITFSMEIDNECFYKYEQAIKMCEKLDLILGVNSHIEKYELEEF